MSLILYDIPRENLCVDGNTERTLFTELLPHICVYYYTIRHNFCQENLLACLIATGKCGIIKRKYLFHKYFASLRLACTFRALRCFLMLLKNALASKHFCSHYNKRV